MKITLDVNGIGDPSGFYAAALDALTQFVQSQLSSAIRSPHGHINEVVYGYHGDGSPNLNEGGNGAADDLITVTVSQEE